MPIRKVAEPEWWVECDGMVTSVIKCRTITFIHAPTEAAAVEHVVTMLGWTTHPDGIHCRRTHSQIPIMKEVPL